MKAPVITVITVVFNNASDIEQTIASVITQTYPALEYIIIDGGSTDGTLEVINSFQHDLLIISEPDEGIYDAMNKGIKMASGQWIFFLNAGDVLVSDTILSETACHLNDSLDIVYGDALVQYPSFQTLFIKVELEKMWKRMPFCHQACLTKRDLLLENPFDLTYTLSSDFNFLFTQYLKGRTFAYMPLVICIFDYTKGASQENAMKSLQERKRIVMLNAPSPGRKVYFLFAEIYLYISQRLKNILGKKISQWLTRLLRK